MKNTEKVSFKTSMFMTFDDYRDLISELSDGLKEVAWDTSDGLYYEDSQKAIDTDNYLEELNVEKMLSEYFDTEVTSVHCDDCEFVGVWIVYK